MSKNKVVDFLSEDSPVSGQKYALISIVGPHMRQKCDVWGLKVKYVADSIEKAKSMSARLVKADPEFDIYTVEVGKFFPLQVEPTDVPDIEYQNEQLNTLIKSYLENRQDANDVYLERKRKMMQDAIKEGKNQHEAQNQKEHPIAVLQRVNTFENKVRKLQEELKLVVEDLKVSQHKYSEYSEEEKQNAELEIRKAIESSPVPIVSEVDVNVNEVKASDVDDLISKLQDLDSDIAEITNKINATNEQHAPNMYKKLLDELSDKNTEKALLKDILTNKNVVNDYINQNYSNPESLGDNVVKTL